ncbi:hypothetical protein SAMN04488563_0472 [Jiangella alkaliphila]|uniref:Matrixin n=2 Tax=Jiangella alkaliphila TaxID=419479 RepID=A0A1H2GFQ2_9ACTN|nr:hypothetical protein SAMN04488563_0472 [Jiangella alkaliphila]
MPQTLPTVPDGSPRRSTSSVRARLGAVIRACSIGAVVVGTGLVAPTAANATPYPDGELADSAGHAFCFTPSFDNYPEHRTRVTWAMSRLDTQTDLFDIRETCVAGTDLWWWRSDLPGNLRGTYSCWERTPTNRCDSANINMDFPEINQGPANDVYDQQKTALHEIGHSVGLGHHSPSAHNCVMISGEIPSSSLTWRSFHSHDVSHINATF